MKIIDEVEISFKEIKKHIIEEIEEYLSQLVSK